MIATSQGATPRGTARPGPTTMTQPHGMTLRTCTRCGISTAMDDKKPWTGYCIDCIEVEPRLRETIAKDVWRQTKVCPRGHFVEGANIVPSKARKGYLTCLVCNRAQARHSKDKSRTMDEYVAIEMSREDRGRKKVAKSARGEA